MRKLLAVPVTLVALAAAAPALAGPNTATELAPTAQVKRVPNVVGKNHQAAQDLLQRRGFFNLRERDCTGRGRLLLLDRNWKVRRQSPRAGARVSTNRAITLCSVKYTD
jgi:hypothetical protein